MRGHQAAERMEVITVKVFLLYAIVSLVVLVSSFQVIAGVQSGVKWLVVRAHGQSFTLT